MRIQRKSIVIPILILFFLFLLTGCGDKSPKDIRIELEAADSKDLSSSDAVFPKFVSGDEIFQKELDKLNKEVDKIRKAYDKRTDKGKAFTVHTYTGSSQTVPQCTICWYEEHSLLDDDYNLMTLAYDKNSGEIMTSKEALNSLQIDGITLSTNVGKLYQNKNLPGILKETEMQGFETDDSAAVTGIYMKLIIEIPDPADPDKEIEEQHFYFYDPLQNTLSPLSEHGFEIP